MKRLRFAFFVMGLAGLQFTFAVNRVGAQTSVFPVKRTDNANQLITGARANAGTYDFTSGGSAQFYGPTNSADPNLANQMISVSSGLGVPYAITNAILTAEQNCGPGTSVAIPQGQSVVSATFAAVSGATSMAGCGLSFTNIVSQAEYEILGSEAAEGSPVAYHMVHFLFNSPSNPATGLTPVRLTAICDTTVLQAVHNGGGFVINGWVGTGGDEAAYVSGPWGDSIDQTVEGYAYHGVGDPIQILAVIDGNGVLFDPDGPPFGVGIGPLFGGFIDDDVLGIGVYSFCTIDDHDVD